MRCGRCGREIPDGESYEHLGQALCEDCYMDIRMPVKACDPWAVYTATRTRESLGLKGSDGLSKRQKEICDFVNDKGKTTAEEVMDEFALSQEELQAEIAVLRHCELVKGRKEGSEVYLVPFAYD